MRIILFAAGIIPIAAGIFFLVNEGQTFVALSFVAGAAMLACGLIGALAYLVARGGRDGIDVPGWVLADSLSALALSVVTLQNRMADDDLALSAFGVRLMTVGVLYVAAAVDMRGERRGLRIALPALGLLCGAMGAYGFFRPFLPQLGMTGILGGIFLLQGVSVVALGAGLSRKRGVGMRRRGH